MCDREIERERESVCACVQGSEREEVCARVVCPRALVCLFCYRNAFILVHLSSRAKLFLLLFLSEASKSAEAFIRDSRHKSFRATKAAKAGEEGSQSKAAAMISTSSLFLYNSLFFTI